MRHLFCFLALAATTACGGDTGSGQGPSGVNSAGASGTGASSSAGATSTGGKGNAGGQGPGGTSGASGNGGAAGAAPGVQCTSNFDCPQLGCQGCSSVCVNGKCVSEISGSGGATSGLTWFTTCGPPVYCPDSGGTSSGYPPCTPSETVGAGCASEGVKCDTGNTCWGPLMCTTNDPTHGGMCPTSRAKYKTDIKYLGNDERARLADDVESIPLVRYRYKNGPEREHLGFIIEDVEPSPSVDSQRDQVDLYGYTSMAIAALQEQRREIDSLKAEIQELRGELAKKKGVGAK